MATCNFDHFPYGYDVPFFFNQGLSYLEIIHSMSKLRNNTKDMFFNKRAQKV